MVVAWGRRTVNLKPASHEDGLTDIRPQLRALVASYNESTIAALLGVDRSTVSRWLKGERDVTAPLALRIVQLHTVLSTVHRYFNPTMAMKWLLGSEPHLGGAQPLAAIAILGPDRVIEALRARAAGEYA